MFTAMSSLYSYTTVQNKKLFWTRVSFQPYVKYLILRGKELYRKLRINHI